MTNPQGARGVTLGMESAAVLADLVRDQRAGRARRPGWTPGGARSCCRGSHDHVEWDAALLDQWSGRPVDPDGPIGLEVVVAAARDRHPEWFATLMPFFSMEVMPAALDPLRAAVREMVRQGWQPAEPDGPTRDQLADLVRRGARRAGPGLTEAARPESPARRCRESAIGSVQRVKGGQNGRHGLEERPWPSTCC